MDYEQRADEQVELFDFTIREMIRKHKAGMYSKEALEKKIPVLIAAMIKSFQESLNDIQKIPDELAYHYVTFAYNKKINVLEGVYEED